MRLGLAAAVLGCVFSLPASAQSSAEFAQMGHKFYAAFECAALAGAAEDTAEAGRLFDLGYQLGLAFIGAVKAGSVTNADIIATVPVGVTWYLEGPNADFMLGRVWQGASENALKDVASLGADPDGSMKKLDASNKFRARNCGFLS